MNLNGAISATRSSECILFDIDGVIVSSIPFYKKVIRDLLIDLGASGVPEDITHLIGIPSIKTVEMFFPPERHSEICEILENKLKETASHKPDLVTGAIELLRNLKERGKKLGAVSSRSRPEMDGLFEHYPELGSMFEVNISRCCVENIKPDPEPVKKAMDFFGTPASKCLFFGDSEHDMGAASACGIRFIGVCSGVHTQDDWIKLGANYIESVEDITLCD